jgi:hypothetical protein
MSDRVGKGVSGPVPMHKSLAAGEKYSEASAAALGRAADAKVPTKAVGKNTK